MGWDYQRQPLGCTVTEHLTRIYTGTFDGRVQQVLDVGRHASTYYVALRVTEEGRTYVTALVVLTEGGGRTGGFGYKTLDEEMGPMECDCPDRIMALLSPLEMLPRGGYAGRWRERVADKRRVAA